MKKILLSITFLMCLIQFSNAQNIQQLGADLDGIAAGDQFGYKVSMSDQNTVAVSSPFGGPASQGYVRVFDWDGSNWIQRGANIIGEASFDRAAFIDMPDDNTLAVGAIFNDGNGNNSGHVRIYTWNGSSWVQKGADIDGESGGSLGDRSGDGVSMPDANTIAIGAYLNDGTGISAGHVRIFEWDGASWVQKGLDIDAEAADDRLSKVSMPTASTVAVGAYGNDDNGSNAGHVRIYDWNGSAWVQRGIDIDGVAAGDFLGRDLSMPDMNTIAVGAALNGPGYVQVFTWDGTAWTQKGTNIVGEANNDNFGSSVSMPSPDYIAIGATANQANGVNAGHVRIYSWDGTDWVQFGSDIDSEAAEDYFGADVSMPDNKTLAVGANRNDGNGIDAGHARIYTLCATTTGTDVQTACDSYTWIDGNTYTSDNNTATFTLTNAAGCDSVVTLDLTINNSTTGTDVQTACDSYTWIDGNTYTADNNTATHVLTNAAGCDSVVTLDLTINNSTTGTDVQTACDSYTWIDGNTYTADNNTATHVLTNAAGCDSVVTLDLTINNSTTGTDMQTACDSYTWIDGNTYTADNNTATFTLTNAAGCDSVVTLDLTINNSTTGTDVQTACDSYTWIDGNTYTADNNTATHVLTNAAGCDSVVTLDLTINNSTTGTDMQTACDSYTWIDGNTYTADNNTATFTLTNAAGCDSVVTLDLTINNSTTGTDVQTACDSYTWIDGNTYTADNNTATHVLTNAAGCDSVVTLDLTINNSTTGTDVQTACDSYTWIDGNTYTADNNTATHVLTNAAGCDSVVTLDLTINNSTTGTDMQTACDSYTWIDGNTYTADNNTATFTLTNAAGCDSVVTLDLTINNSTTGTDMQTACDSYTWIDGNTYTADNNTATFTLTNAAGCDSVVTLDLTINNSNTGTDVQEACDEYTWIDGNTYTSDNNTATFTLTNAAGCDSVVTLDLTINTVDISVSNSSPTLSTTVSGASYQWLDCDDNYAVIPGETNQDFTATVNGSYAVAITQNNCTDTSACETVDNVGIQNNNLNLFKVYPNPAKDQLTIELSSSKTNTYRIVDATGRLIKEGKLEGLKTTLDVSNFKTQIYFIKVDEQVIKFVKH